MAVTPAQARKLALSFEGAEERPHFDRFAFRTPRKTFATLAGDGSDINLMFDIALQELYSEQEPEAFAPLSDTLRSAAISLLDLPSSSMRRTLRSRSVSCMGADCRVDTDSISICR